MDRTPAKDDITTSCYIRQTFNLCCRTCKYFGKQCDNFKEVHKVDKPFEYRNNNINVE